MTTKKIFSPIKIGNLKLKNRVTMAPMVTREADPTLHEVNDFHKVHYGARAIGGVALIMMEGTSVSENGFINIEDLGLYNDNQKEKLKELVTLIHSFGSKIGVQLNHSGRKALGGKEKNLVAPSAIAYSDDFDTPREMSHDELVQMRNDFANSAHLAKEVGIDVIELHIAHGYLLNQFISPLANKRTDNYGGSLENRYRFIHEVIEEVKKVFTGSLWARISADEYDKNGSTIDEMIQIASWLKEDGIELIDVSTGGVLNVRPPKIYPGYQAPYAKKIKEGANIAVGTVGLLNDPKLAEYLLQSDHADLITLGRPLLSNPNWLLAAAKVFGEDKDFPVFNNAYERGKVL